MKISVIQQKFEFGYDHEGEPPSLEMLTARAEERLDECFLMIGEAAKAGCDLAVTIETVNAKTALGDVRYPYTELYEGTDGKCARRFSEAARRHKIYIVAGLLLSIDGAADNCAVLFDRRGEIVGIHKKVHLPAGEELHVAAGDRYDVFDTEFGKIGMLVCWDMQFPEAARELALGGADLICCPTLGWENIYGLSRAYENSVNIAAAMRVFDKDDPSLVSPSCIVDNMGSIVASAEVGRVCVATAEIDIKKEPAPQYGSTRYYPSRSMRKTRLSQRRPDTYRLASLPNEETPLYRKYFGSGGACEE